MKVIFKDFCSSIFNKNFSYKALTEIIKYKPLSFEEGIKETVEWYDKNRNR